MMPLLTHEQHAAITSTSATVEGKEKEQSAFIALEEAIQLVLCHFIQRVSLKQQGAKGS